MGETTSRRTRSAPGRLVAAATTAAIAATVGLGCSALLDFEDFTGGIPGGGSADGAAGDGGSSAADDAGARPGDGGAPTDGPGVRFHSVVATTYFANDCPCELEVPSLTDDAPALLLAVSMNAHDEHPPQIGSYDGAPLGDPIQSDRVDFSRVALWIVPNARPGTFSVDWNDDEHYENGVMMAAVYNGVSATIYVGAVTATGDESPAELTLDAAPGHLPVSFFVINDTTTRDGLTAARIGAGQTYRLQYNNETQESQLALGDGANGDRASWAYASDSGWAAVAVQLVAAPLR